MMQLFYPNVGLEEWVAVQDVFRSGWLGAGPKAAELEKKWANLCGGGYCVTVHNATEALFQIVDTLSWNAEVVMPAIHFIGAANAVLYKSRRLVLCDVDPTTLMATPEHIFGAVSNRTKAILLLHYSGMCDVQAVRQNYKGVIIEDAAAAVFATNGEHIAGTFGDFGVWSFDAMKPITGGDGGMIWCRKEEDARGIRAWTKLGVEQAHGCEKNADDNWWEIESVGAGRLSQMNDIASAIVLAQIEKRSSFQARRKMIASIYMDCLRDISWLRCKPVLLGDVDYFFWVQTDRRDRLARHLRSRGIYTSFRYWPLHRIYNLPGHYPGADEAARTTLLLPCHSSMTSEDAYRVVEAIKCL